MPVCQIATVGFKPDWIQKGLFKYPTDLLILITTPEFKEPTDHVKEVNKEIPIEVKIVEKPRETMYLINFFKEIIINTVERGYEITVNVTSGLTSWQLILYLVAIILEKHVTKFFIFDKELGTPIELLLYTSLTDTEKKILGIIGEEGKSLDAIVQEYRTQHEKEKGSKGLISRYMKELMAKELVDSDRSGKKKKYFLTTKGKIYTFF